MSEVGRIFINQPAGGGVILPPTIPHDPAPTDYLGVIVADGAVAAWPLEEDDAGAVYADVIGSLPATLFLGATSDFASTPIGPATTFSPLYAGAGGLSTTDTAAVTDYGSVFDVGTADFALECWAAFAPLASGAYGSLPIGLFTDDLTTAYVYGINEGDGFALSDVGHFKITDANSFNVTSPARFDDSTVRHFVLTRRSGTYFLIVDGLEVASDTPGSPVSLASSLRIHLGGVVYYPFAGHTVFSMAGRLAWAAFYGGGLSAAQAMAHYLAGGGG